LRTWRDVSSTAAIVFGGVWLAPSEHVRIDSLTSLSHSDSRLLKHGACHVSSSAIVIEVFCFLIVCLV
jgi:hypothetical protein